MAPTDGDGMDVVARVCLDMLRSCNACREDPMDRGLQVDSVMLAPLVVLEPLEPAERPAFVLHDLFARRRARSATPSAEPALGR